MPLDIAAGVFIAIGLSGLFGTKLTLSLVLVSVLFALFPDVDFVYHHFVRGNKIGKLSHKHRDLLHKPLPYLFLGSLLFLPSRAPVLALFLVASAFHFLHDSVGVGWGIKWLYPFSNKNFKFFVREERKLSRTFLVAWGDEEVERLAALYGEEDWIKRHYLRFHPVAIIEIGAFVLALIVLFLKL